MVAKTNFSKSHNTHGLFPCWQKTAVCQVNFLNFSMLLNYLCRAIELLPCWVSLVRVPILLTKKKRDVLSNKSKDYLI